MKKQFALVFAAALMMAACGGNKSGGETAATDSLAYENECLNQFIGELATSMDSISGAEDMVFSETNVEGLPSSDRERVKRNIEAVREMLQRQKDRIAELEGQLGHTNAANAEKIKKIVASLNRQIEEKNRMIAQLTLEIEKKDANIMQLHEKVSGLSTDVANLKGQNAEQEQTIAAQDEMINEGYYIVASKSKLKEMGLLEGGFLKKKKLNAANVDVSKFNKVDIRNVSTISIPAQKAQVMTQHPATSYAITPNDNGTSTLTINDKAAFWSLSTVLVVKY